MRIAIERTQEDIAEPYAGTRCSTAIKFNSTKVIGEPLLAKWEAAHPDAGFPPFDLETRNAYPSPDKISQQDYDDVIARKAEFKAFSEEHILRPSEETCSESLLVLDSGAGGLPSYREEFLNHHPGAGFLYMTNPRQWLNPLLLSSLLSAPQVDLPIGQVDYQSVISLQTEKLPVVYTPRHMHMPQVHLTSLPCLSLSNDVITQS